MVQNLLFVYPQAVIAHLLDRKDDDQRTLLPLKCVPVSVPVPASVSVPVPAENGSTKATLPEDTASAFESHPTPSLTTEPPTTATITDDTVASVEGAVEKVVGGSTEGGAMEVVEESTVHVTAGDVTFDKTTTGGIATTPIPVVVLSPLEKVTTLRTLSYPSILHYTI